MIYPLASDVNKNRPMQRLYNFTKLLEREKLFNKFLQLSRKLPSKISITVILTEWYSKKNNNSKLKYIFSLKHLHKLIDYLKFD